jgi:hypothetical protein
MSDIILGKVKKLLNLGNSPNEAEAQAAIEKAHSLLKEYNLSISDIKTDSLYDIKEQVVFESKNDSQWKKYIMMGVAKANYCMHLITKSCKGVTNQFIGKEHNVVVAIEMTNYLIDTVERLAKKYPGSIRGDYKKGLAYRLCERLHEINKKEKVECNALVIQEESMIKKYIQQQHTNIKSVSTTVRTHNYSAFCHGMNDANSIGLNGQVGNNNSRVAIGG